jgi:hypothetical protein
MRSDRHILYLRKIAELFGRRLKPKEYSMLGKVISNNTDETLDKAIEITEKASTTNQVLYFLSVCSSLANKNEDIKPIPRTI